MKTCQIRLLCPEEGVCKPMDPTFESGGGFRWVEVHYEVNPVGSDRLYRVHQYLRNGSELDAQHMEKLNYPDIVDEAIAAKIHGEYAKKVLKEDLGQLNLKPKYPSKHPRPKPADPLDLGELPLPS